MIIDVTQADIDNKGNPIENAVKRQYGKDCSVDRKFIIFKGNETHPFRLSLVAQIFNSEYYEFGSSALKPFSFEIGATV